MSQGAPSSDPASNNGEPHAVPEEKKVPDLHYSMNTDGILEWVDPLSDERRKFGQNLGTVVQTSDNDSTLPAEFSVPTHPVQEDSLPAHYEVLLNGPDASPTVMVPTASGVFETVDQIASNNSANTAVAGNGPGTSNVQFVPLLKSEFDAVRESLRRAVEDVKEPLKRVALGMLIHDQISLARRQIAENPIQCDPLIDDIFERVDQQAYTLLSNLPVIIDDYSQIEGLLPAFLEVAAKHYDDAVQLVMKTEKKVGTSLGIFQKFLLNIIGTISKRFPVWIDTNALGNRINAFLSSNDLHRDDKPSFDSYCRHHREEAGLYRGAKILFMTYVSLWESMMPSIADRKMMDWLFARIEEAHRKLSETIDSMDFKKKDKLKELWQSNLAYIRSSFDEALEDPKAIELPLQRISIASAGPSPVQTSAPSTREKDYSLVLTKSSIISACDIAFLEMERSIRQSIPDQNLAGEVIKELQAYLFGTVLPQLPEHINEMNFPSLEPLMDLALGVHPFLHAAGLAKYADRVQEKPDATSLQTFELMGRDTESAVAEACAMFLRPLLEIIDRKLEIETIELKDFLRIAARTFDAIGPHLDFNSVDPLERTIADKLRQPEIQNFVQLTRDIDQFLQLFLKDNLARIDPMIAAKLLDVYDAVHRVQIEEFSSLFPENGRKAMQVFSERQTDSAIELEGAFPKQEVVLKGGEVAQSQVVAMEKASVSAERRESVPEVKSMPRAEFERLCHQMGDEIFAAVSSQFTLDPTVFDPYSIRKSVDLILKECPEVITQENYGKLFDFFNYSMPYGILLRKVGLHRNIQKRITPITDEDPDKRLLFCEVQFKQKTREILSVIQEQCGVPTIGKDVFRTTLNDFALTQPRAQMAKSLDRNVYKLADFIDLFLTDLPEQLDRRTMTHFISVLYKSEIVGIDLIAGDRDDLHAALKKKLKEAEKSAIAQIDALLQPPQLSEVTPTMTRAEFETLCTQIVTDVFKKVQPTIRTIPIGHPSFLREFAAAFSRGCPERISRDNFDALDALHEGAVPYPALLEAAGIPEDIREKIIGLDIKPYDAGAKEVAQARLLEATLSRAAQLIWETVIRRCRVPTMGKLDFQNELPATFTLARRASEQSMDLDTTFQRLAHFATGLLSALPERIDRKLLSRLLDVLANAEEVAIDLMTDEPEMRNTMRAALQESKQNAFVQMDALLESIGPSEAAPSIMTSEKPAEKTTEETFDPDTWSTDITLSREASQELGVALWNCPLLTRDLLKRKVSDIFSGILGGDIDTRLGIKTKAQRQTELTPVLTPLRDVAQRVVSHVTQSGPVQTSKSYRALIGGLGAIIKNCQAAHLRIALTEYLAEAFSTTLDGLERMVLDWEAKRGDGGSGKGGDEDEKKDGVVEESQPTLLTHKDILKVLADANEEASQVLGIKTVMRKDKSLEGIQSSTPASIRSMNDLLVILYSTIGRSEYLQTYASNDAHGEEVHRVFERSMRKLAEKMPDVPDSSVNLLSLQYLSPLAPLATVQVSPEDFSLKCDEVFSEAAAARIAKSIPGRVLPVALLAMKESMERIRILLQDFAKKLLPDGVRSPMEIQMLSEFLNSLIFRDNVSDATDKQFRQTVPRIERKTTMTEFSTRLLNRWNSMVHAMLDSVMHPPEPEKVESTPGETGIAEGSDDRASGPVPTSSVEDEITAADVGVIGSTDHEPETEKESVASGEVIEPTPEPEPIDPLAEAMYAYDSTDPAQFISTLFETSLTIHGETAFKGMVDQHSMQDAEAIAAEMERVVDVCNDAISTAINEIMQAQNQPSVATVQVIANRVVEIVTTAAHEGYLHIGAELRDILIKQVCGRYAKPDLASDDLLIEEIPVAEEETTVLASSPDVSADSPASAPVVPPRIGVIRKAAQGFVDQRVRAEQRQQLDVVLKQLQIIETERPGLEDGLQKAFEELRARAAGGDMEASATVVNFHNMQQQFLQYFQLLLDSKQS